MLTKRIIACLDVRAGRVVKGVQFVDIVDAGDPAELAHRHAAAGADEIVLLDITATHEGRGTLLETVRRTAAALFVPFTVGGGVRSADDAAAVFDAGADKVSINSAAIARPELIGEIGGSFGAQAVIVAIDARRGKGIEDAEVYVSGGRTATGRPVVDWAREAERRGAGELLLTSMDADGTRRGFDCELTAMVSEAVQIPVIASGGAGTAGHFAEVFGRGRADAALAASIFHFGVTDSRALKGELRAAGGECAATVLNLPTFLTPLETAVIATMLDGTPEHGSAISCQLAQSELLSREHNGYGFYTTFLVAPATQPLAFVHKIIHANALVDGQLCGFMLWMNEAKVDFLEGYPLGGDAWPSQEIFEQVRLS